MSISALEGRSTRYTWKSFRFEGADLDEATSQYSEWFGYGTEEFSLTRQKIRKQADGSLHMFLSHVPQPTSHVIYVTALMQVVPEGGP